MKEEEAEHGRYAQQQWVLQRVYDLAGVSPNPSDAKSEGIRRYKEKFGGEYFEYPIYAHSCSRIRSALHRQIRRYLSS